VTVSISSVDSGGEGCSGCCARRERSTPTKTERFVCVYVCKREERKGGERVVRREGGMGDKQVSILDTWRRVCIFAVYERASTKLTYNSF
jgi:hypothetical protein